MSREEIINRMCLTFRHDYGIRISEGDSLYSLSGMTETEAKALYSSMSKILDNDILPVMEFKKA